MEEWRDIPGYENHYQASVLGRIRSVKKEVYTLNPSAPSNRYKRVTLSKNGIKKQHSVHRLVLSAFSGESNQQVNHMDGNKENNELSNLEYCTPTENIRHAWESGLRKDSSRINGELLVTEYRNGASLKLLSRKYSIDSRNLKRHLRENGVFVKDRSHKKYPGLSEDSKKEVLNLKRSNPKMTYASISKELGISISSVGRIIKSDQQINQ